jgi:hypothetical protein
MSDSDSSDEGLNDEVNEIKNIFKIFEKNKLENDNNFSKVTKPRTYFEVCLDVKV